MIVVDASAVVDLVCGLLAANGIQAALVERARTGDGRHVEVSLMDSALTCLLNQGSAWVAAGVTGLPPPRKVTPVVTAMSTSTAATAHGLCHAGRPALARTDSRTGGCTASARSKA